MMHPLGIVTVGSLAVLVLLSISGCDTSAAASPEADPNARVDPEQVEADAIVAAIEATQAEAAHELSARRAEFRWHEEVAYELGRLAPDDPRSLASLAEELEERGLSLPVASARLMADAALRERTAMGMAGVETLKSMAVWMKEAKLPSAVDSAEGCVRLHELAIEGAGQCVSPAAMGVLYLALAECDVPKGDILSPQQVALNCTEAEVGWAKRSR